jgi:hypothetical protein
MLPPVIKSKYRQGLGSLLPPGPGKAGEESDQANIETVFIHMVMEPF